MAYFGETFASGPELITAADVYKRQILVEELLDIASEVVVHRITQVGRIRAGYYTVILIV